VDLVSFEIELCLVSALLPIPHVLPTAILSDYVKETVGSSSNLNDQGIPITTYVMFNKFVDNCEEVVYPNGSPYHFRKRVDFNRFKEVFPKPDGGLDSLTVWTQIRSFIKGSIEALKINNGAPLSLEQYSDTELIGSKSRCRLKLDDRVMAYAAFENYEKVRPRVWV